MTANGYGHLLYAGGWQLQTGVEGRLPPETWDEIEFGQYHISVAPEVPRAPCRVGQVDLMMIGRAVDPFTGTADQTEIAHRLAAAYGRDAFLERLDNLTGRFVIVVDDGTGPWIFQDAVGTRAVYYRAGLAASHSRLVDCRGLSRDFKDLWKRIRATAGAKYLPGVLAPHLAVRMLTPNTRLHVPSGSVGRFWPRHERHEQADVDALAEQVAAVMPTTIQLAASSWPLCASLSAGLDSRLTLAASRGSAHQVDFFSHLNPGAPKSGHLVDLAVAQEIAERFSLRHRVYYFGKAAEGDGFAEFSDVFRTNLGMVRSFPSLIKAYVDNWPRGTLHLRSNVAEVGRAFYRASRPEASVSATTMARWWNPELATDPMVIECFEEFASIASFTDERLCGYAASDLFYWEHRMGTWHSLLGLESDMAHDTFPPFSNRRLLAAMLSAPYEVRKSGAVFHRAIELMWPELHDWPVNPEVWPLADTQDSMP